MIGARRITTKLQKLRFNINAGGFLRVVGGLSVEWRDRKLKSFYKGRRWTPWPNEIRERAVQLHHVSGLACKRVVEQLRLNFGVESPLATAYFWLERGSRSWGEYSSRFL